MRPCPYTLHCIPPAHPYILVTSNGPRPNITIIVVPQHHSAIATQPKISIASGPTDETLVSLLTCQAPEDGSGIRSYLVPVVNYTRCVSYRPPAIYLDSIIQAPRQRRCLPSHSLPLSVSLISVPTFDHETWPSTTPCPSLTRVAPIAARRATLAPTTTAELAPNVLHKANARSSPPPLSLPPTDSFQINARPGAAQAHLIKHHRHLPHRLLLHHRRRHDSGTIDQTFGCESYNGRPGLRATVQ
ncbi:hypothetical protein EDB81DRAFT_99720 [Dactylonectria macrodidyma]|uniref:Uncharacterized protein n=1 Tax=Dactylonectria macrodidyma TaxID=307937 RepID=A0A9P9E9M7_9HYPO|nr:hypothetical protein EDB81DRAFT_99720 [Dactylonectria macrodidyma]